MFLLATLSFFVFILNLLSQAPIFILQGKTATRKSRPAETSEDPREPKAKSRKRTEKGGAGGKEAKGETCKKEKEHPYPEKSNRFQLESPEGNQRAKGVFSLD